MTFQKVLLALALGLIIASCEPPTPPAAQPVGIEAPQSDPMIRCTNKYSGTLDIIFHKSQEVQVAVPMFPGLIVYHITDIKGKHWSVNQYEMDEYVCLPYGA